MKRLLTLLLLTSFFSLSAQIDLKYNLQNGQSFKILTVAEQAIDQEIMGQTMQINQSYTQGTKFEVMSVASRETRIKCTYYRIAFKMSSMAGNMSFDSADPASSNGSLAMTFGSMVGKTFFITMDQTGTIKKVEGMDAIVNEIIESTAIDQASKSQLKMQLETQFGSDAIAKSMEQGFMFFPANGRAKQGDQWAYDTNLGIYDVNVTNVYSLTALDANTATISLSTTMDSGKFSQNMNGQQMEMELSGTQSGSVKVERQTGMIIEGVVKQDLEAKASTMGMTIPMKIKGTNTFTREN